MYIFMQLKGGLNAFFIDRRDCVIPMFVYFTPSPLLAYDASRCVFTDGKAELAVLSNRKK